MPESTDAAAALAELREQHTLALMALRISEHRVMELERSRQDSGAAAVILLFGGIALGAYAMRELMG